MNTQNPCKKFESQREKVQTLLQENSRFKRIYEEYDYLSDNLWDLEQTEGISITDDFINYIKVETNYLEDEITFILLEKA
ncbi:hypothetical protein [Frigoriflavimonas asaccharolytica]|uniref:Uncharacterized protein YdcH (DUF465 family) n=1 Tax=Frigoriflavimonas asaccharolytica TaxID=2735899 RepID=A0A8J8K802_9FLAO|nr:hypothetical protein [Frigoriflavimonas asaccharolytica]NRS92538.1 uncharacterized protein YdcH (DUF465 family) [Frigoriflavimonas asaccharolytica]